MTATVFSFQRRKRIPDPRNGEVYATESASCYFDEHGQEIQVPAGFSAVHMSQSGSSGGMVGNFPTMAEAQEAAREYAERINAVYVP